MQKTMTGSTGLHTFRTLAGKVIKNSSAFTLMAALCAASVLSSCKKDQESLPPASTDQFSFNKDLALAPAPGGTPLNLTDATGTISQSTTGGIYTVSNYFVDQGISNGGSANHKPNGFYYFDLSDNDNRKGATATTPPAAAPWDISFSGTGNADIRVSVDAELKYINQPFSTVATYTAAQAWSTSGVTPPSIPFGHNRTVATADQSADAPGHTIKGWYNYWFAQHQVLPTNDLTVLIRDEDGDVYALHMINVYKNGAPYEPGDNTAVPASDYSWLKFEYKKL